MFGSISLGKLSASKAMQTNTMPQTNNMETKIGTNC